jgi:lipopolysaccharide biosynthesis glycosyltransferase
MKNLVAIFANRYHFVHVKQLVSNLYWHCGWEGDYMLLTPDVEEAGWFQDRGVIVKQAFPALDVWQRRERIYSSKLHLFTEDMKQWQKIVYLDSDILIRGPFPELLDVKHLNAVTGPVWKTFKDRFRGKKFWEEFSPHIPAFNGGVWCFNTDIIDKDTFRTLQKLCRKYRWNFFCGGAIECTLSLFFYDRVKFLPRKYNCCLPFIQYRERQNALKEARILHFVGANKCWKVDNVFYAWYRRNLVKADQIKDVSEVQPVDEIDWGVRDIKLL